MQRARIMVNRLRRYSADASFEVFGDLGSGLIDAAHPLTPRPVRLHPEAAPRAGHLSDGHLTLRHLDSVDPDGRFEGVHLFDEHLYPASAVTFDTPPYVFGRFLHEVRMSDGAGNVSAAASRAITVNGAPTVPECVTRSGYDAASDRITFSFTPSRFIPVGGK